MSLRRGSMEERPQDFDSMNHNILGNARKAEFKLKGLKY